MEKSTMNTILAIVVPFTLTTLFALYTRWSNKKHEAEKDILRRQRDEEIKAIAERVEAMKAMTARVEMLERDHAAITAQVVPINAVFQSILIKQLTHFHTPVIDALMVKLGDVTEDKPRTITDEEEEKLLRELKRTAESKDPEISEAEREAAEMLPIVMKRVKREAEAVAKGEEFAKIQVVGLLPEGEKEKE